MNSLRIKLLFSIVLMTGYAFGQTCSGGCTVNGGGTIITQATSGVTPPAISSTTPPSGIVALPYAFTFTATGGVPPYAWSATGSLPSGLTLDSASGVLSGTPDTATSYPFSITVTDSNAAFVSASYTVSISSAASGLPTLPTSWVDNSACNAPSGVYDVTKTIPGDFAATQAGFNSAIAAWVAASDQWWHLVITAGTAFTPGATTISVGAKAGATKCLVVESSSPPVANETVCSHGTDNYHSRNAGCTNDIAKLYTVTQTSTISALKFVAGANHVLIRDGQWTTSSASSLGVLIDMGDTNNASSSTLASTIGFERNYIHGSDSAPNDIQHGLAMACSSCWAMWNYFEQIHSEGLQSQAIWLTNSQGPLKIVDNWIEGGSERILAGGSVPPNGLHSSDIEIRGNRLTYDPNWINLTGWQCSPSCAHAWNVANALEFKDALRFVIVGNILEYSWKDAQTGHLIVLGPRAGYPTTSGFGNEGVTVSDGYIANNIFRHAAELSSDDARSGGSANGNGISLPMQRIVYENNLGYDIVNYANWCPQGGCNDQAWNVGTSGNTFGLSSATRDATGLIATITINSLTQGTLNGLTDFQAGDPIYVQNCTDASFNTATNQLGVGILSVSGLTITYPSTGTANASTAGAGCTIFNKQGWQHFYYVTHNTVAAQSNLRFQADLTGPSNFPRNFSLTGGIYASSLYQSSPAAGFYCSTKAEGDLASCMDATTATMNSSVIEGRTAALYTEYPSGIRGGQPGSTLYFPTSISCSTTVPDANCIGWSGFMNGQVYPPVSWINFDYHDLSLCTGSGTSQIGPDARCGAASVYYSTKAAATGTLQNPSWLAMGPDVVAIDAALAGRQFTCPYTCTGTPYADGADAGTALFMVVSPLGNDSTGTGTFAAPYATFAKAKTLMQSKPCSLALFRGGMYLQGSAISFNGTTDDGAGVGCPTTYQGYWNEAPVVSGAKQIAAGSWTNVGADCGTGCTHYKASLASASFANFEGLFYNNARRYHSRTTPGQYLTQLSGIYATDQSGGSGLCRQCNNSSVLCPTAAVSGNWVCFEKFKINSGDVINTYHGIGLKDVEIDDFERWTMSKMRLASVSGTDVTTTLDSSTFVPDLASIGFTNGWLCLTGASGTCTKGNRYQIENCLPGSTGCPNQLKVFYLDRCPGCASTVTTLASTWELNYYAISGTQTSVTTESANTTSSCSASNSYCNAGFTGLATSAGNTNAQTKTPDAVPGNVPATSVTSYLYTGFNGEVLCEYQPWFSNVSPFNGHVNIKMNEDSAAAIAAQHTAMLRVGCTQNMVDYYGAQESKQAYNLSVSTRVATDAESRCVGSACPIKFDMLYDQGAFDSCPRNSSDQKACIEAIMFPDMDYIRDNFCNKVSYWKVGGKCVVPVFVTESNYPGTCWQTGGTSCTTGETGIWNDVKARTDAYTTKFLYVGRFGSFTSNPNFGGEYAWPQPPVYNNTDTGQLCWDDPVGATTGHPCPASTGVGGGVSYLNTFYTAARANPTQLAIGMVEPGFDWSNASWNGGVPKIIAQQCGQVLRLSGAKAAANGYSSASQLAAVVIPTWNDYEEGTEVETGLNNCITPSLTVASGTVLNLRLAKSDLTYGSTTTIAKMQVYYGDSSGNLFLAADNISPSTSTLNVGDLIPAGTWNVYLKTIGTALIQSKLSNPLVFTSTNSSFSNPEDPSNSNNVVYIPQLTNLVTMTGTKNVTLRNLSFAHVAWNVPADGLGDQQTSPNVPGGVKWINTQNVVCDACVIRDMDGAGLDIYGDGTGSSTFSNGQCGGTGSCGNQLINSAVYSIGDSPIRIGRQPCTGPGQQQPFCTVADTDANTAQHNLIKNTQVVGTGRIIPTGNGAVLIINAHDNLIQNNEIWDTYQGGIGVGLVFGQTKCPGAQCLASHNTIDSNHIHNFVEGIIQDTGGVYTATGLPADCAADTWTWNATTASFTGTPCTVISNNTIHDGNHDVIQDPVGVYNPVQGIYHDQGSSHHKDFNNLVYRVSGYNLFDNLCDRSSGDGCSKNNWITNNILAHPAKGVVNKGGINPNGPFLSNNILMWGATSVGRTFQNCPGHWGNGAGTTTGLLGFFDFQKNIYNPEVGLNLDFVNSNQATDGTNCATQYTHYNNASTALADWSAATGEDIGSIKLNPNFGGSNGDLCVNGQPVDNYTLSSSPGVGFVPWNTAAAGTIGNTVQVPIVPQSFPNQLLNTCTDF